MTACKLAVLALLVSWGVRAEDCATLLPRLEQQAGAEPASPEAQVNLGVNRFRCGMAHAAIDPLRNAIALAPSNSSAYFYLGVSLLALDREEEAKNAFRRMAALNPGDADQLYLIQKGYARLSSAILERISELSPDSARLNLVRAELFDLENRPDQALEEYRKAVVKQPQQPALRYALGSAYWGRFRAAEALPEFAAAVELDPLHYMAHYKLGLAMMELDRGQEAMPHLEKSVQIQPGFANGHFALAKALVRLGHSQQALASLDTCLAIDSGNQSALYLRAQVLLKLGRTQEANEQLLRFRSTLSK